MFEPQYTCICFFEFEILIIVLSQVARNYEGRDSGLSTLGESGALEQDADIVIFLH
ncbi:DnaB-like helicase C-terminal domain-containing protein [Borreliella afzelii]|uniref:DnaB-like helicase C-terminal domain-containing protein n=1 Tax=Borreliella afzelii TaxID=29518 RepID=UPI00359C6721